MARANVFNSNKNHAISSVTLKQQAEDTFRNGKIPTPYAMRILDNGQLTSEKNEVDLLNFVLDKIWDRKMATATKPIGVNTLDTSSSTTTNANNEATDIQTKGSSARSPSWVFKVGVGAALYLYACLIMTD